MSFLTDQPLDFFINSMTYSEVPMFISNPDGKILWVNKAFEEFIGYNSWELIASNNGKGISVEKISVNDENMEADRGMIKEAISGNIKTYSVKKQYIPKNEKPVWVDLHVIRYPMDGELKYFIVTLLPLKNGTAASFSVAINAIKDMNEKHTSFLDRVSQMEKNICTNVQTSLNERSDLENIFVSTAKLIQKYPRVSGTVILVILVMLLGNQLLEAIQNIRKLIGT